jgi:hypothetical protein
MTPGEEYSLAAALSTYLLQEKPSATASRENGSLQHE